MLSHSETIADLKLFFSDLINKASLMLQSKSELPVLNILN